MFVSSVANIQSLPTLTEESLPPFRYTAWHLWQWYIVCTTLYVVQTEWQYGCQYSGSPFHGGTVALGGSIFHLSSSGAHPCTVAQWHSGTSFHSGTSLHSCTVPQWNSGTSLHSGTERDKAATPPLTPPSSHLSAAVICCSLTCETLKPKGGSQTHEAYYMKQS